MNDFESKVRNDITVEAVLKSIIKETSKWGFRHADYLKLVNALLDLSLNKTHTINPVEKAGIKKSTRMDLPLSGDNINIRLFKEDFDLLEKWLEDDYGRWFLLSRSYSRDKTLKELIEDERNLLGIIFLKDSTPIGVMGYLDYDKYNHKAEMRKLIGEEKYREKGFAKEATELWIKYGICNLGLNKIYLNTIENNIRNVTLNKELGFEIEGILRNECFIDGNYYNLLRMSLIVE